MSGLRRRLRHRDAAVTAVRSEDLTVDLLRFAVSGVTLAMAVVLTLAR